MALSPAHSVRLLTNRSRDGAHSGSDSLRHSFTWAPKRAYTFFSQRAFVSVRL